MSMLFSDLIRKEKAVISRQDAYFFMHQHLLTVTILFYTEI